VTGPTRNVVVYAGVLVAVAVGGLWVFRTRMAVRARGQEHKRTRLAEDDADEEGGGRRKGRERGGHTQGWITLTDGVPKPEPSAAQQKDGLIVFKRSVLERMYPDSHPRPDEMVTSVDLQATRDAYEAVQLGVYALADLNDMHVLVSDLRDDAGHVIPATDVVVRMERFYGAQLAVGHPDTFGVVPKTLEVVAPLAIPKQTVRPYWITVHVPADQPGGVYRGTVTFKHAAGTASVDLVVEVVPVVLDEPPVLYGTLCVNVLSNLWKSQPKHGAASTHAEGKSLDAVQSADVVFRDQREHGMTTMSLRSGAEASERDGHPYLADLETAIDLYKKYGFTQPLVYCAGQLLRTNKINRSNNYKDYDPDVQLPLAKQVAAYYTKRFHDEGLPGIAFMPVEEPNLKSGIGALDPPDVRRRLATTLIGAMKAAGAKTAMTCTPQSVTAAIDDTDYWIVAYRKFEPKLFEVAKQHNAHLGLYANATMMGQGTYFPRFMFGYYTWASGLQAMLPWTYPMQPKRFPTNVGGRGEGGLNVHHQFIGLDNKPIPTVQWELSREGIDDARYLATIERLAAAARKVDTPAAKTAVADADRLLATVRGSVNRDAQHYTFEDPQTLAPQGQDGWDTARFEATRKQSVQVLKQLLAVVPEQPPAAKTHG